MIKPPHHPAADWAITVLSRFYVHANPPYASPDVASRATAFSDSGFTLTELAIAVAIVGILTGIALPNYFNAVQRARQSDASSQIMTILTSVQAYREEFLEVPNSWDDIAQITPVMTDNGIATGALTTPITTPNGGHFQISFANSGDITTARASKTGSSAWGIRACLNTTTGVSDLFRDQPGKSSRTVSCT